MFFTGMTNGNGNGELDMQNGNGYDVPPGGSNYTASFELPNFFIQLGKSKLVKGGYDGSTKLGLGLPEIPIQSGMSFFAGSTVNFNSNGNRTPDIAPYRSGKNAFFYVICQSGVDKGAYMPTWDDSCGVFTPEEIQQIDTKIDDGSPLSGIVFGFGGTFISTCLLGSTYNLANKKRHCDALYIFD